MAARRALALGVQDTRVIMQEDYAVPFRGGHRDNEFQLGLSVL